MTSEPTTVEEPTAPAQVEDAWHVQRARRAAGILGAFNQAGVLGAADVHVAARLGALSDEDDEAVLLAGALAVRAVRLGSVCLDVAAARDGTAVDGVGRQDVEALPWPEPAAWLAALEHSPLVAVEETDDHRPLRLVDGTLYLDRYWRQERVIADAIEDAADRHPPVVDDGRLRLAVGRLFPSGDPDRQRLAAVVAAHRWFSVVAGGPGTGKTTTVAKLLAVLQDQPGAPYRIALAAPTGRAAARLLEAVTTEVASLGVEDRERLGPLHSSTLHRLLGVRPGSGSRFRHNREQPLPYDVVVVDEASMVSLTMMARLIGALRPATRLVLVGDPDQLASVEAGAVLGDLVAREALEDAALAPAVQEVAPADLDSLDPDERHVALATGTVRLSRVYRFSEEVRALAEAIRTGDVQEAKDALAGSSQVELVEPGSVAGIAALRADVVEAGGRVTGAARIGDATAAVDGLSRHRLLCAHRTGPYGVDRWSALAEQWLATELPGYGGEGLWYVGRPLLVTSNDYQLRLFNGDTGVIVAVDDQVRAAFRRDGDVGTVPTSRLAEVQTMHAMSIHRSQGSQFDRVTVVLPPVDSPLLTRELLYTAVTRAKEHVRIIGSYEALARAVERPIVRATGLRRRRTR